MSLIISVALIVEYLFFLFLDLSRNHDRGSKNLAIRLIAGATGIALITLELFKPGPVEIKHLALDVCAPVEILLLYPCSFEKPSHSLRSIIILETAIAISFVFFLIAPSGSLAFRSERIFFSYIVILLIVVIYFSSVMSRRFGSIRLFFRNTAVWYNIEDYSRFIYSLAFLSLGIYSLCAALLPGTAGEVMSFTGAILFMCLYAVLYLRDLTGRTYILNFETERKIKDIIKGNLRTSFIDKAEEDKKMNNLYNRVMLYMNEKQPYLDPDFHMEDLAEYLYSNKLYLSRTINILSGRNFRQFVNYHRVQHAISLFKKDPRMRIGEVASLSGFNSTVSFNMAFKINTGKTPSEWLQEHSLERMGGV